MPLTSPILPWLIGVIFLVVFAALVIGWPDFTRRSSRMISRGVATLLLNVLIIALCFVLLNNNFIFYSSWSDALGTGAHATTMGSNVQAKQAASSDAGGPGLSPAAGTPSYQLPQPGKRLQSYTVDDAASGQTMQVLVYLPKGYDPAANAEYPVIMGYHGFPGTPHSFTKVNFLSELDSQSDAGDLHRSIVVIPQINNPSTVDTECVNGGPGQPQTETWLAKELPEWTVNHLHVRTDRQSWTTLGYSFGGWCAAAMTMRHPDIFSGGMSFEGYFEPDFGKSYQPLSKLQTHQFDLVQLAQTARPPVAIWLFASQQDPLAYPSSEKIARVAAPPTSVTSVFVPVGGHRNGVFEPYTADALKWLATSLPGFAP